MNPDDTWPDLPPIPPSDPSGVFAIVYPIRRPDIPMTLEDFDGFASEELDED